MTEPSILHLLQAAPQRDTVVTVAARDGVDLVYALAAGSVFAVFLALLVAMVVMLLQMKKASRAIQDARRSIATDRGVESLRKIADNVADISGSLRGDVAKVSDSVDQLSRRLTQVSNRMEERVEEFNALMEVVQEEAEDAFLDGASTARGFRAGLGNLSRRARRRARARLSEGEPDAERPVPPSRPSPPRVPEPASESTVEAGRNPEEGEAP